MINDVPHIAAECAECGFLFDLRFGTDCPACHHTGVRWARLVTPQESESRRRLSTALDRIREWQRTTQYSNETGLPLSLAERKSIDECEAIFALDSTGSRP